MSLWRCEPTLYETGKGMLTLRRYGVWLLLPVAVLGGFALARLWGLHGTLPQAQRLPVVADCSLSTAGCPAPLPGGGEVRLEITPRPIALMRPLQVTARVAGQQPAALWVDIVGINMEMGLNRAQLLPSKAMDSPGVWAGELLLPLCSERRMQWEARLLLEDVGGRWVLPFRFETAR